MTTVLDKQTVEVITIYSQGKYKTVKKNGLMYLVLGNSGDKEEVIAWFTPDKQCTVLNRDLACCWISENTKERRRLERFNNQQLQEIIAYWLDSDLNELIAFENKDFDEEFNRIFNKFSPVLQKRIIEGLEKLEVMKDGKFIVPHTRLITASQMDWAGRKLYPFAKLAADTGRYDIFKRTIDAGYIITAKNGWCGSFKNIEKNKENRIILIFDRPVKPVIESNDVLRQIKEDLKGTPYAAANKFVKLEEKLTKEYNNLVEVVTNQKGFIDSTTLKYPNIDDETSAIASLVRKAQKAEEHELQSYIDRLILVYNQAYTKLQQSKANLEELCKQYGILS